MNRDGVKKMDDARAGGCASSEENVVSLDPNPQRCAFLAAYAQCGSISHAANAAGIDRRTHYFWMEVNPDNYRERFATARQQAIDALEDEATRRAQLGVTKGIYYKGQKVAEEQVYSDTLLMFRLNGEMPQKYRQRADVAINWDGDCSRLDDRGLQQLVASLERRARELQLAAAHAAPSVAASPAADQTIDLATDRQPD